MLARVSNSPSIPTVALPVALELSSGESIVTVLQLLYSPIFPFVGHPERAFLLAIGFALLWAAALSCSRGSKLWIHVAMIPAMLGWVLFGLNEYRAIAGGWNIRVDMIFSWPPLCVLSIAAAWMAYSEVAGRPTTEAGAGAPEA